MARRSSVSFDAIRALLYDPPSTQVWRRLWRALERADPDRLENELLPYIRDHLSRWPKGLRVAPGKAVTAFLGDERDRAKISDTILALTPLIDSLSVPWAASTTWALVRLSNNPSAGSLHHLELTLWNATGSDWNAMAPVALARSEHFYGLRSLSLDRGRLSNAAGRALVGAGWFQNLTTLKLTGVHFKGLEDPIQMPHLTDLDCTGGELGPLFEKLASPEASHDLRRLRLQIDPLPPKTLGRLIAGSKAGLKTLSLSQTDEESTRALLSSDALGGLESLNLEAIVGREVMAALKTNEGLSSLRTLSLTNGDLQDRDLAVLADARHLSELTALDLKYNGLGDAGLDTLLELPCLSALTDLNLKGNAVRPEGLGALLSCGSLSKLQSLNMSSNPLRGRGLKKFGEPSALTGLETLAIGGMQVDDAVVAGIEGNPSLSRLKTLRLFPCALSLQGLFEQMTRADRDWQWRTEAFESLLDAQTRPELLAILNREGVKVPSNDRNKPRLVEHCVRHFNTPERLARFLTTSGLGWLSVKALKGTARRAGLRGYSKKGRTALEAEIRAVLGPEGEGLS